MNERARLCVCIYIIRVMRAFLAAIIILVIYHHNYHVRR